ncbi:MAG: BON domain-containing protein [Cyanobacteria bacterium RU_5_0]|nr:BON domain-containing protein [Cyanobacteria bacterium RU_5_0]
MTLPNQGDASTQRNSDSDATQLANFLSLLIEMDIITPITSPEITPPELSKANLAIPIVEPTDRLTSPEEPSNLCVEVLSPLSPSFTPLPSPASTPPEDYDEAVIAFKHLQNLLVAPELDAFRPLVETLEQKLYALEHQIYDPTQLMSLLLPWIAELIGRKIEISREEVVQAIAPIVDSLIQERAGQNKDLMSGALAPLISSAITHQINDSPEEITQAVAPMMGKAIREQIRLEKDAMVDALYPVIGATVSKYLAEAIQSINDKIERTLSFEGIQRKIRAQFQGVSEAELILREALPCSIEAIFLIHKTSGLVIAEAQQCEGECLESEMIAGMLTAIRSFANDCIARTGGMSELSEIDYGDFKILLEAAGYCYIAVVVQGEPSPSFNRKIRRTLGSIVQHHGMAIETFEGDPVTIPNDIPTTLANLRDAYPSQQAKKNRKPAKPMALLVLAGTILSLILVPASFVKYRQMITDRIESSVSDALTSTPELAVYRLDVDARQGKVMLVGKLPNPELRQKADVVARSTVRSLAPRWSVDNEILAADVLPDPELARAEVNRITNTLNRSEGIIIVAYYIENNNVLVEGVVANAGDVGTIERAFQQIPGIQSVSTVLEVQSSLNLDIRFYFDVASAQIVPDDLGYKLSQVVSFLAEYPEKSIKIIGFSYPSDSPGETPGLALQRAIAIRDALIQRGINPERLEIMGSIDYPPGMGADHPSWLSRCVDFEVK